MGFVATPSADASHDVVRLGVEALARLAHRGGLDADGKSGDGAGLLIQVPQRLLGRHGVAVLFEWDERARGLLEEAFADAGLHIRQWRQVPVDPDSLGEFARASLPGIWQGLVEWPALPVGGF
jgi:glutamate synthase domain-containing protein 1